MQKKTYTQEFKREAVDLLRPVGSRLPIGWQACLEQDLLQSRQVGSGILAEAQLLATGLAPKGELLTHAVPCLKIFQGQGSR